MGTEVVPLGGATLSLGEVASARPASSRLFVGNLSFNGADGFSVQIGAGSGGVVGFLDEAVGFPVGGEILFETHDNAGYIPCVRVTRLAGGVAVDPELGGASSYRAEVWNDGVPVGWADGFSATVMRPGFPTRFRVGVSRVIGPLPDFLLPAASAFALRNGFSLLWDTDAPFGTLGTGDELRIYPEGGSALAYVASIDVLVTVPAASAPYTMSIDVLAQEQFGRLHSGKYGARLVSRMDAGGATTAHALAPGALPTNSKPDILLLLDGSGSLVSFPLDPRELGTRIQWSSPGPLVDGDWDEFSMSGTLLAGGEGEVWKVTSLYTGSGVRMTPQFGGGTGASAEVHDAAGNLVASAPGVTMATYSPAYFPEWTNCDDKFEVAFGSPVTVSLPGVGVVTGSRITWSNPGPVQHSALTAVSRYFGTWVSESFAAEVEAEAGTFALAQEPGEVEYRLQGTAFGTPGPDGIVIHNFESALSDFVSVEPCILPGHGSPTQFAIQWAPLGPPSASMGRTDWAFLTQLSTDVAPVERLEVSMASDGTVVRLFSNPGPSQSPDVRVVLRNDGQVVADFIHSGSATPFAELPDWPVGIGYRELLQWQQPWSMVIVLGYGMNVTIPGPTLARTASVLSVVTADEIEAIVQDTPSPGPAQRRLLAAKISELPFLLIRDSSPNIGTGVGDKPREPQTVLWPAYPNPFNPSTRIGFDLVRGGHVSLRVYAVDGSHVATIHDGVLPAGIHHYQWMGVNRRGQRVASGVYLVELRAPDGARRTKVNLLK